LCEYLKAVGNYVYRNNIRTHLRYLDCSMPIVLVSTSTEGTTITARAMLSVRDTAIAAQKISPEFEQCSWSVPLVLSNTVLFLYDRVADIRPRRASGVVTTLTGNPLENSLS
jgi:hypothetical protein